MPSTPLSPFQTEKLQYYFRFLDPDENGNLEKNSLNRLMDRILDFTGWDEDSTATKECRQVHEAFFEILFEKQLERESEAEGCISMDSWLSMWSAMLPGVMGMPQFPVWLRLMPKVLFKIVDRKGRHYLTAHDLELFYKEMVHLAPDQAHEVSLRAFEQMTDNGKYPLDAGSYEQLFANFLIGKTPNGPGRYIFGCFEHKVIPFRLIQPLPEPTDDVMEIRKAVTGRRPSQLLSFS